MDDQAPLQALPHCELRYGLKLGRIPAADLVAEHLCLKVFALGVMQDRGECFLTGIGGAVAANFDCICAWFLGVSGISG